MLGLDFYGLAQEKLADCCEHGDEPSGSMKCGDFFD
jgi:hypothetical protein